MSRRNWIGVLTILAALLLGGLFGLTGFAAEGDGESKSDQSKEQSDIAAKLQRVPPKSPQEALETFEVHEGFHLEQVAAEPMVTDPVAMAFDARGRLFVAEMRGYSEQRDEFLGRIRLLTDTDGDGKMDGSTIYAKNLPWPTAVFPWDGGVFVAAAPNIFYFKDTDGDGKADQKKKVFTGFGNSNVQQLVNGFTWGFDHRIHMSVGSNGGEVRRVGVPDAKTVGVDGYDFAFDPRTMEYGRTSGSGQWGIGFDDWGRKFTSTNSDHFQMVMYPRRYIARNPHLRAPNATQSIAASGPQGPVYRISPVPSWRVIRTKMRVAGTAGGLLEGRGRAAGYFSASTGTLPYKGDAYPPQMRNQVFLGDVSANVISRKKLVPNGVAFIAERIDPHSEFVASTDLWFRPVAFANAPDGTLWFADMYREVVEHPWSLPPSIKKHLDLTSGRDMGRIYRIAPDGFEPRPAPNLAEASTQELVQLLAHPNAWHHKTASRLLYQRQDESAVEPLRQMATSGDSPLGRMHALHALEGLDALNEAILLDALQDEHPRVRTHAIRLSEPFLNGSRKLRDRLLAMTDAGDIRLRYQLAFTLGEIDNSRRYAALADILQRDGSDRWIRLAALSSLGEDGAAPMLKELAGRENFLTASAGRKVLEELARQAAAAQGQRGVAKAAEVAESLGAEHPAAVTAIFRGLRAGMPREGETLRAMLNDADAPGAVQLLDELLQRARRTATNPDAPTPQRVTAIDTLTLSRYEQARPTLTKLLAPTQPQPIRRAALHALGQYPEPAVADVLLDNWDELGPDLRPEAMDTLLAVRQRVTKLLDAIEEDRFAARDLSAQTVQRLNFYPSGQQRNRARRLLLLQKTGPRYQVVEKYREAIANLEGDPEAGRAVFRATCAACHKLEGVGQEIAPNLAAAAQQGANYLLVNVIDPNRELNPRYEISVITTTDGQTLTGMITNRSPNNLTLTRASGAKDNIPRSQVESIQGTGRSLMPEGLEAAIDPQAMADLLAYLMSFN